MCQTLGEFSITYLFSHLPCNFNPHYTESSIIPVLLIRNRDLESVCDSPKCYGLNCVRPQNADVLTPRTCECDLIWK